MADTERDSPVWIFYL